MSPIRTSSVSIVDRIVIGIGIRVGFECFLQSTTNGRALGPAAEDGIVVPDAELGQPGGAVVVATGILPGVDDSALDVAAGDAAEGIIVVASHQVTCAVGHAHNRALPVEEVVVDLARRGALTVEQTAATTDVLVGRASCLFSAQAQAGVDRAGPIVGGALRLADVRVAVTIALRRA
nr:hypothetical protein [Dictyobacter kobayashii]